MKKDMKPVISLADFNKLDLKIATVVAVDDVAGADKLWQLTLDIGEEKSKIVLSGIKAWYSQKDLIGKQVVYLANLESKMIRGIESQGMILAAVTKDEEKVFLLKIDNQVKAGTKIT